MAMRQEWKIEDVEYLKKYHGLLPICKIAKHLNRKSCHTSIHFPEKLGELLGTPNGNAEGNQQPSRGKVVQLVPRKVQRLTAEDTTTDKADTSARHATQA